MILLAQAAVPMPLLIALGVLIVAVVIGGVVLMLIRNAASKAFLKSEGDASGGLGLMEEMRRLRDSGAMSREEYERVRSKLISRAQKNLDDSAIDAGASPGFSSGSGMGTGKVPGADTDPIDAGEHTPYEHRPERSQAPDQTE